MANEPDFSSLYEAHRLRIFHLCQAIVHDHGLAEDLTQTAFVHAYEHLGDLRDPKRFGAWLTRIAKNLAFSALRSKHSKREPLSFREEIYQKQEQSESLEELKQELFHALHKLSDKERAVFELHELEGKSHKEIAALLHIQEGTSRSRLHYARRKIRVLLKKTAANL